MARDYETGALHTLGLRSDQLTRQRDITGASLGYRPSMATMPARVPGESESGYRNRVRILQGNEARQLARQRGLDTSGMRWTGDRFTDANYTDWYEDPAFWGPVAVAAAGGIAGATGGAPGGAPPTTGTAPAAFPAGTTAANGLSIIPPAATGAGTAAIPSGAAVGGAAAPAATTGTAAGITNATRIGTGVVAGLRGALRDPATYAALAPLLTSLFAGRGNSGSGATDEMRRMQAITEAQMRRADPLHQVAVQMAYGRAPTRYRQGTALSNVQLP